MRQAVILAGGKGTRLAARLNGRPKPLVDVLGTPLLERQVEQLKAAGVRRVLVLVNHMAEQIEAFCASHDNWGLDIALIDDGVPRGTAGAVFRAFDALEDEFLVVYGDTLFDIDFQRFLTFHDASPAAAASLFLHPNDHPQDSDLVEVADDGAILRFHAYPHPSDVWLPNMVNAALYAMRKPRLAPARAAFPQEGIVDFAKDVFPWQLAEGAALRGYVSSEYIKDIGTPDRLDRACAALASGKVHRASLKVPQRAVFLDRDGTLNVPNGHIARPEALELFDFAPEAVRVLNGTEYRVIMVTNQPVVARGDCTFEGLATIHAKLETELGRRGAFLERIYYCPHHPDKGFDGEVAALKTACDCRKPKPGLLRRAEADLNIALSESWMIGDSAADIQAAAACGVASVLVRTGEAADPAVLETISDFAFDDVLRAARFIAQTEPRVAAIAGPIADTIAPGSDLFLTGQSKSGKTTLARTLARKLRLKGQAAVVVSLDRWMIADHDRTPGLLGRFDLTGAMETYKAACARLEGRIALSALPVFSLKTRRCTPSPYDLVLTPETVVIWEGVLALALAEATGSLDRCVFVETDELGRRDRVVTEYIGRGRSEEGARQVYHSRLEDEVAPINAGRPTAARVVSIDACFEPGSPK